MNTATCNIHAERYWPNIEEYKVTPPLKNVDLPYLRAKFIFDFIHDFHNFYDEPIILRGDVANRHYTAEDRNVQIVLYIK